jgi:uncharacterized membrane protein
LSQKEAVQEGCPNQKKGSKISDTSPHKMFGHMAQEIEDSWESVFTAIRLLKFCFYKTLIAIVMGSEILQLHSYSHKTVAVHEVQQRM